MAPTKIVPGHQEIPGREAAVRVQLLRDAGREGEKIALGNLFLSTGSEVDLEDFASSGGASFCIRYVNVVIVVRNRHEANRIGEASPIGNLRLRETAQVDLNQVGEHRAGVVS